MPSELHLSLFFVLISAASGCATVLPQPLPPLPEGASAELNGAYQGTRAAYSTCGEHYVEAQNPWQLYPSVGGAVVGVTAIGSGAGLMALDSFDAATRAGLSGGLGALGLLGIGVATYFGDATATQWDRSDAYRLVLERANKRAGRAIAATDSLALTELTRVINENCRAVDAARGDAEASLVIKDIERWRDSVKKGDAQRHRLAGELTQSQSLLAQREAALQRSASRVQDLESSLADAESSNNSLRGEVARLEEEQASLSKRQQKLLDEKRKLEEKTTHYADLAQALQNEVKEGRVALRQLRNGVVVEMQNKVLFPSGSADLNDLGSETLSAVAEAIKTLKDRRIRVEGHTDNVPVGKSLAYKSNWELSAARAITVTRFLQEKGVPPSILSAEARGEYAPIASNKSPKGRARNRRIEIYLVPKPRGSTDALKLDKTP